MFKNNFRFIRIVCNKTDCVDQAWYKGMEREGILRMMRERDYNWKGYSTDFISLRLNHNISDEPACTIQLV